MPRINRDLVGRAAYRTLYYFLCLLLALLLCVTPADLIRHNIQRNQWGNVVGIIAICGSTALMVLFIYSYRLYANRTALDNIPRYRVPITKFDPVPKNVRFMIDDALARSAAIALENQPKIVRPNPISGEEEQSQGLGLGLELGPGPSEKDKGKRPVTWAEAEGEDHVVTVSPKKHQPVWGKIRHPGWGAPDAAKFANVEYETVIKELGHLMEARAVSLAPPAEALEYSPTTTAVNDPRLLDSSAVSILSRHPSMGMRKYLYHLVELGVIPRSLTVSTFIDKYEHLRFATRPVTEDEFNELMDLSAQVMGSMQAPDMSAVDSDGGSLKSRVSGKSGKSSSSFMIRE